MTNDEVIALLDKHADAAMEALRLNRADGQKPCADCDRAAIWNQMSLLLHRAVGRPEVLGMPVRVDLGLPPNVEFRLEPQREDGGRCHFCLGSGIAQNVAPGVLKDQPCPLCAPSRDKESEP